jgi:flagellar biosynthetic protein FliQ
MSGCAACVMERNSKNRDCFYLSLHGSTRGGFSELYKPTTSESERFSVLLSGVGMSPDSVMSIARHALEVMLLLAMPLLLAALVVGLVVGIFQAATQINESTLSFIPKLIGVAVVLMIGGSWMLQTLTNYTRELFMSIPRLMG